MSTITQQQAEVISAYLASHVLPSGLGTEESACSIAAINLALTGKLTDKIPECMSHVIGQWIIRIQDAMPDDMRNSAEWKRLLPLAAGTGRDLEPQRKAVAMEWMWTKVLTQLQPIADKGGYGEAWLRMTTEKTQEAALGAKKSASASTAAAYATAYAASASTATAYATASTAYAASAYATYASTASAASAASAAYTASAYATYASTASAASAASAAYTAYTADARKKFWEAVDPCACLAAMIGVSE